MKKWIQVLVLVLSILLGSFGATAARAQVADSILCNGFRVGAGLDISGKDVGGCDLTNVDLTGIKSGNVTASIHGNYPTLPVGWALLGGYLLGPTANLTGAQLSNLNLGAWGVDLSQANLFRIHAQGITWYEPKLPEKWKLVAGYLMGPGADLSSFPLLFQVNFANLDLSGATLSYSNLGNADLSQTKLDGVFARMIKGCPTLPTGFSLLPGWPCLNSWIVGPSMGKSSSLWIDLKGLWNDFSGTDFSKILITGGSNIGSVNFQNSDFSFSEIRGAFENCDFSNSTFEGAVMNGADFQGAVWNGIRSKNVDATDTTLPANWGLVGGYLIGPQANLTQADLTGLDLSTSNLSGVRGGPITGSPTKLPPGWDTVSNFLVGPSADVSGVNFEGADLTHVDLSNANIEGANLNGATLGVGPFTGIKGVPAKLPASWVLDNGVLEKVMSSTPTPIIIGAFKVGSTLTATIGTWDAGVNVTLQWLSDGTPIAGATNNTYKLTPADLNHRVSLQTTGTADGYRTSSASSAAMLVAPAAMQLGSFSISGKYVVGQTLTAKVSAWVVGARISYQWLLDGKAIKGATRSAYKLLSSQKGHKVSVLVKQSATGYLTATKTSTAIKVG